jgi:hypothetical protein
MDQEVSANVATVILVHRRDCEQLKLYHHLSTSFFAVTCQIFTHTAHHDHYLYHQLTDLYQHVCKSLIYRHKRKSMHEFCKIAKKFHIFATGTASATGSGSGHLEDTRRIRPL